MQKTSIIDDRKECPHCGSLFMPKTRLQRFCSPPCAYRASSLKMRTKSIGKTCSVPTGTVGAINELRVCADLLARGYGVFRSLSPACPCDLVIMTSSGKLLRVEVKTVYRSDVTGKLNDPCCANNEFDVLACAGEDEIVYHPHIGALGRGILP